jgi:release factor glutamine methyltransferase
VDLAFLDLPPDPHVYPLREDSLLLARATQVRPWERVLEVGCGLGLSSLLAARTGARVVASDVNPYAVRSVRASARRLDLAVDPVRTDLFEGLRRFDVVLCNPPYLASDPSEVADPDPWHQRAVDGGADGREFYRRFLANLPDHLTEGGRAYLLVASTPEAPVRTPGLPVPSPGVRVVDLAGDAVLPRETLWVLELKVDEATAAAKEAE